MKPPTPPSPPKSRPPGPSPDVDGSVGQAGGQGKTPVHCLVRASAGTGKTYALTTKVLELLHQGVSPEHILATTFTRKAAGEILGRVLARLARASLDDGAAVALGKELGGPLPHRRSALDLLRRLCDSLDRITVSTLDSFFLRMAMTFHLELGLPPSFELAAAEDPSMVQLRWQALEALLDDLAGDDLEGLVALLEKLHPGLAHRPVARELDLLLRDLYDVYRQAPEPELWSRLEVPPALSRDAWAAAVEGLEPMSGTRASRAILQALAADRGRLKRGRPRDLELFLSKGLAPRLSARPPVLQYRRGRIPPSFLALYRPLVQHARAVLLGRLADQTRSTHRFLAAFDERYTALRLARRRLLFSDLPWYLANELPRLGDEFVLDLYYRLDRRIGHLLLDEFQDTSLEQWRILEPLAREIRSHGDGSRSFYCVGDPKQAIYNWRGGCPELFGVLESDLALASPLTLRKSYRSSSVVLDAVNRVFSTLVTNPVLEEHTALAAAWLSDFETHEAHRHDLPGYVELVTSPHLDRLREDAVAEDPEPALSPDPHDRFVATRVAQLTRMAPNASLGVLVRTNRAVHRTLHALRLAGVLASGEGGSPIADDPAVALILAALRLADHPSHSLAAFQVANSPLGEWLGLASADRWRAAAVSRSIRRDLLTGGYTRLLTSWARVLAPFCDRRGCRRLSQLMELAEEYEPHDPLRPGDFVVFVEESSVEDPDPGLIRVMTVHKSKGLEFDLVFLPDLDRRLQRTNELLLYTERDSPVDPVKGVYRSAPRWLRDHSPELQLAFAQEQERRLREELSELYVAMTRARLGLWMILQPPSTNRQGTSSPNRLSHASLLRGALTPADAGGQPEPDGEVWFQAGDLAAITSHLANPTDPSLPPLRNE